METNILPVEYESLQKAKEILLSDGVVAFPTETVYGLGGNAFSDRAIQEIYSVKGRPSDNPLIVHVHSEFDISSLVYDDTGYAKELRKAFLPGPLTLVYRSKGAVSAKISCGLDTLAIRVPSNENAQRFLKYVDRPIAAPSANRSKHISPVSAQHVYEDLQGKIPLILDGGVCIGGIESTVCDVTGEYPVILRTGLVSKEMIEKVAGKCEIYIPKSGEQVRSPGMKYKHYAPACKTYLFEANQIRQANELFSQLNSEGKSVFILCEDSVQASFPESRVLNLGKTPEEMAARLYELLHEAEKIADVLIAIKPNEKNGVMAGVQNRLGKACAEE